MVAQMTTYTAECSMTLSNEEAEAFWDAIPIPDRQPRFSVNTGKWHGFTDVLCDDFSVASDGNSLTLSPSIIVDHRSREWIRSDSGERFSWSPTECPAMPCMGVE